MFGLELSVQSLRRVESSQKLCDGDEPDLQSEFTAETQNSTFLQIGLSLAADGR